MLEKNSFEIFDKEFNYSSPLLHEKLIRAESNRAILNFLFNSKPTSEVLSIIQAALKKYKILSEIMLTLTQPKKDVFLHIEDFTLLKQITYLNIGNFAVNSLEGVERFPSLNRISIGHLTPANLDFSPLTKCESLHIFSSEQKLTSRQQKLLSTVSTLKRLTGVHGLNINLLNQLPNVVYLEVHGLVEPERMAEKLPYLEELAIIKSTKIDNLNFLSGLTKLKVLRVIGPVSNVEKLPDFSNLNKLTSIYLRDMKRLEDIETILSVPNLKSLRLSGNIELKPENLPWFNKNKFPGLETLRIELNSKTVSKQLENSFYS